MKTWKGEEFFKEPIMTMTELKEDRIWIDGCFDFFHHGEHRPSS